MSTQKPTKVLFVCMGNICRSPAAEGIMKKMAADAGKSGDIECDSAGTIGYHTGELPDPRMRRHAQDRGYMLDSRARQFDDANDFELFDLILTMDDDNFETIRSLDARGKYRDKVRKMTSYCRTIQVAEVPDPYYGGRNGFENVLDILEDACGGLLETIPTRT